MTTILILLLCYVVAATVFVRWMKNHAPEGYESEEKGFVMTMRTPSKEEMAVVPDIASASARPVWNVRSSSETPLQTTYHAGRA